MRASHVLGKLLMVDWVDSASFRGFWNTVEDHYSEPRATFCRTVGWVVVENDEYLTLGSSTSSQDPKREMVNSVAGSITIPKCAIKKRRIIR